MTSPITQFQNAMQCIYGPFESLSNEQISDWDPPPMAEGHRGRYLWTDGFAVVNFITLYKECSDRKYLSLAQRLIHTVHETLGRTRDGTARLPGATDEYPLKGGLRIGKHHATGPDADGQYHHYLTIWMFALNRMSIAAKDKWYNDQAISLAKAIHPHFMINRDSPRPRMFWKMSMDLRSPLVGSEGNLDPIDGYVIFKLLQKTAGEPVLAQEISEYKKILDTKWRHYVSEDPLDLGMTLWTAHWFNGVEEWATTLTNRAFDCLCNSDPLALLSLDILFEEDRYFESRLRYRLAFREFGTCMGIGCYDRGEEWSQRAERIMSAWQKRNLMTSTSEQLQAITMVMFASALIPGGKGDSCDTNLMSSVPKRVSGRLGGVGIRGWIFSGRNWIG